VSRWTTSALQWEPTGAGGTLISQPANPGFNWGAWTEMIASLAEDTVLAGIQIATTGASSYEGEVAIGVGTAGNEVAFATFKIWITNSTTALPGTFLLRVPMGGLAAGARVSARISAPTSTFNLSIGYYENFDSDYYYDYTTGVTFTSAPTFAAFVAVTPSGTDWNNSGWAELTSGLSNAIGADSIAMASPTSISVQYEVDWAIGGAGSETLITTVGSGVIPGTSIGLPQLPVPVLHYIAANTRIAYRLRKNGTDTTQWKAALHYYIPVTLSAGGMFPFWGGRAHIGAGLSPFCE
jgi:hypothetical protein